MISVIVASHRRLNFLDSALESVLAQEEGVDYEVILVTPFDPCPVSSRFDRRFSDIGVSYTELSLGAGYIGQYLAAAASAARGEVLALIDDDDTWAPQKLREVERRFSRQPNASFLHNGCTLVDESGRPLTATSLHRIARHRSVLAREGAEVVLVPSTRRTVAMLNRFEPGFNNSSISIKRDVLLAYRAELEQVEGGEDMFLYLCSIASGLPVMATSDKLTHVRIHSAASTTNVPTLVKRNLHRNRLCLRLKEFGGPTLLSKMVLRESAFWGLLSGVALDPSCARDAPRWIRVLLGSDSIPPSPSDLMAVCLGATGYASPRLARAVWKAWRVAW